MELQINGKKIDFTPENETTLGEVLGSIESSCERSCQTITSIHIDGQNIPADDLDEFFKRKPETIKSIELETITGDQIRELLAESGKTLCSFVPLQEIPVELQTGKDMNVMETINTFSIELQNFYRLLPLLPLTGIKPDELIFEEKPLLNCPTILAPLLEDLLSALKENDTIMVGDLSEYELAPRIAKLGELLTSLNKSEGVHQ